MRRQPCSDRDVTPSHLSVDRLPEDSPTSATHATLTRRCFFSQVATVTAATLALDTVGIASGRIGSSRQAEAASDDNELRRAGRSTKRKKRAKAAKQVRIATARGQYTQRLAEQPTNGDEERYPQRLGNFTKALPHNERGEVDQGAYAQLLTALDSGKPADFSTIRLGGTVKLTNPQASYAFALEGSDSHRLGMLAPPAFSSAEEAGEMAELYWQAHTRDVPFLDYPTASLTTAAAADLSRFSDFRGPKVNGSVTPATLFRGNTVGDLTGPYLSQFLWKDIPSGAMTIAQKYRTTVAGEDFLTDFTEWGNIQNGKAPTKSLTFDPTPRYLRNNRDLGNMSTATIPIKPFSMQH